MKIKYLFILITFLFLSGNTVFALPTNDLENNPENAQDPVVYIDKGDMYYSRGGDWLELALKEYLKAKDFISDKADYNYKVAYCYYQLNNLFESQKYFNKAYDLDASVTPDILYRMGQGAQFKLQFDKAIEYFNRFKENLPTTKVEKWELETEKRIVECETGKELLVNFSDGLVLNSTSINSEFVEHSPLISNDGNTIFFTSRRPTEDVNDKDEYGRYYENIYVAHKDKNGNWQEAENIGSFINSNDNNATVGLSPDNKDIYIYYGGINGGDIFVSSFVDSVWSQPVAMPEPINSRYQETAISFSPNRDKVYFVSDRPNGKGGKDIWVATLNENGKYKGAKVLNSNINTVYDERAVFIDSKGTTMYFSSEGHKTMGGFDIFKSVMDENGEWGKPENIGYPVNTPGDDIFYVTSADNKKAYFSSIKLNTKGEHDIYAHVFSEEDTNEGLDKDIDRPEIEEDLTADKDNTNDSGNNDNENVSDEPAKESIKVNGFVKDQFSKEAIQASMIFRDVKTGEWIEVQSNSDGSYETELLKEANYIVEVQAEGYSNYETSMNFENHKEQDILLTVTPEFAADCEPIILKNIQFDFDKASIHTNSYDELNQLVEFLKKCGQYKIEVNGYTCNIGTETYNLSLSTRRAGSIIKYLKAKGIENKQIQFKGYGEDHPIGDNNTKEGKIINRRVEFRLIR